ncbi:MAG: hypothetical protein QM758_10600 [Armatimonas sp.]
MARQSSVVLALALLALGAGCNKTPDDGIPPAERKQADQLTGIVERSGGDWNRLSEADRAFLKSQAGGDEKMAQMLLAAKAGKLKGKAGGAPKR